LKDTYQTIEAPTIGEYKEKGSKFIAYAYHVEDKEAIKQRLEEVKRLHNKARHHCYAYRIGLDNNVYRANDDGEPSGTAGRPILGQLDSFGLRHVLVVVVRYFGGTKLGTSGLKRAYKESTIDALEQATVIEKIVKKQFQLTYDYAITAEVMNYINKSNFKIKETQYTNEQTILTIAVRLQEIEQFEIAIAEIEGLKCELLVV
jgi:uncharacterized YigZ family protein